MALTCPKCERLNKCDCKSCNPDGTATDLVIIVEDEQLYQCWSCGHKFDEQDSLDFEWDRMHQNIKKDITPDMALKWKTLSMWHLHPIKERKKFETDSGYGEYWFESAFFQHFGIRHKDCSWEQLEQIKLQLERENKLNKLLTIKTEGSPKER